MNTEGTVAGGAEGVAADEVGVGGLMIADSMMGAGTMTADTTVGGTMAGDPRVGGTMAGDPRAGDPRVGDPRMADWTSATPPLVDTTQISGKKRL